MFVRFPSLLAALSLFFAATTAHAGMLAQYDFDFLTPDGTTGDFSASNVDPELTASDAMPAAGIGTFKTQGGINRLRMGPSTGVSISLGDDPTVKVEEAWTNNEYFSITLTPITGLFLRIADISVELYDSGNQPAFIALYSSLDNPTITPGSPPLDGPVDSSMITPDPLAVLQARRGIELNPAKYSGLSSLTFYFVLATNSATLGEFDNIAINGVLVPEPSTGVLGILMLACLGLTVRRSFRRRT